VRISPEQLSRESEATGFRPEILEKVLHLLALLTDLFEHPFLRDRLALKGGTALNLFVFDVPRLSVDIDLNCVGSPERAEMLAERPRVEQALQGLLSLRGYRLRRIPEEHAGGKWYLRYPSALGGEANLELDLNFMFREPLWPLVRAHSRQIGESSAAGVFLLDPHELAAGKLAALFGRATGRDLFDTGLLLHQGGLDPQRLRVAFVVYGAMNRIDWRTISLQTLDSCAAGIAKSVTPLLRRTSPEVRGREEDWVPALVEQCRHGLQAVLPFTPNESEFLDRLLDHGEIMPGLLTTDEQLAGRISRHPLLEWKAINVRRHRSKE
jgi:predicted nucleotidyltransferase component of viral defense system